MARDTDDASEALDAAALARWGAVCALLSLLGLFMAAGAADEFMFVAGMAFVAFGLFLGTRLLARWRP